MSKNNKALYKMFRHVKEDINKLLTFKLFMNEGHQHIGIT
ncbi:hypothetical protein IWX76_002412 [Pedobacter sp. CAN_A7]